MFHLKWKSEAADVGRTRDLRPGRWFPLGDGHHAGEFVCVVEFFQGKSMASFAPARIDSPALRQ